MSLEEEMDAVAKLILREQLQRSNESAEEQMDAETGTDVVLQPRWDETWAGMHCMFI